MSVLNINRNLLTQSLRNPEVVRQIELLIQTVSAISPELGAVVAVSVTAALVNSTGRLIDSVVDLTDGQAGAAATLNNAPVAGNPTKWISVNDNGTTRYIPAW